MPSEDSHTRVAVTAYLTVEITDEEAVLRSALDDIERSHFDSDGDRAAAQAEVRSDPTAALSWLLDPAGVAEGIPGVRVLDSHGLEVAGADGDDSDAQEDEDGDEFELGVFGEAPDFAELFSVCTCGRDSCDRCGGFQLTPRTAAVLWTVAQLLADHGYNDVIEHGDDPVADEEMWELFGSFPRVTWRQNAVWRRQAARSFDDLTEDLAQGRWPSPSCPAEEMALHLVLQDAPTAADDDWDGLDQTLADLPEHADDLDWDMVEEVLFQDSDILALFDPAADGVEDPDNDLNKAMRIGDYRPEAWFATFANRTGRDPRRPFRR